VLLAADLADLFDADSKVLLLSVKRSPDRIPNEFMFQLTDQGLRILRLRFVTSGWGGRRYAFYVFREPGVAMFSSVLNGMQISRDTKICMPRECDTRRPLSKSLGADRPSARPEASGHVRAIASRRAAAHRVQPRRLQYRRPQLGRRLRAKSLSRQCDASWRETVRM
jgi:hypothetical protein